MAKTLVTAQAQNADNIGNIDFNGFATQDSISQVLVQHRILQDDRQNGVGNSFTAFGEIIKGDGVNGKIYDIYPGSFAEAGTRPRTDTNLFTGESLVFNGVSQANVSEIFNYLNAGGSNVKHTRFTYSSIGFTVWKRVYTGTEWFNPSQYPGTEYEREIATNGIQSHRVDIYWGKYVKISRLGRAQYYENLDTEQLQALYSDIGIFPIDELSGEINLATMIGSPYTISVPINSVYSERQDSNNSALSYFYVSDYESSVEAYCAPMINLDTRKITGLPIGTRDGSLHGHKLTDHNWTIETDDFATTVSAPTPQEDVSGTKISELSSTSSLQDNDLLVISRDEGSDGSFDTSYNVSLSNLAAKMINDMPSGGATVEYLSSPGTVFSYNSVGPVSSPTSPLLHNTYQTYDIPSSIPSSAQGIIVRFHTRADEGKVEVFAKTGSWSERIVCRSDGRNNSDDSASDVNTFIIPYSSAIDVKIDWTGGSNEEAYFYIDGYIGG